MERELYDKTKKIRYFFENDFNWYLPKEIVERAYMSTYLIADKEEKKQIKYIKAAELLKNRLAKGEIDIKKYRDNLIKAMKKCSSENDFCILDETDICKTFYDFVDKYIKEDVYGTDN